MGLSLVTDATQEPVTLSQAKDQVLIAASITAHDPILQNLIKRARKASERLTRRAWLTQTWRLTLQRFPAGRCIEIPRPPLASVTSITYVDSSNVSQTLDSGDYNVRTNSSPGLVALAPTVSWPTTHTEDPEAVTVTYVAGDTTVTAVPAEAKQAILALIDYWFLNRDKADIPDFICDLLSGLHCGVKFGAYGVTA